MSLTPATATRYPIAVVLAAYRSGRLDPLAVCEAALERARRVDPALRAYRILTDDLAREQAAAAAAAVRSGEMDGLPLLGIPIAIKDAFHLAGEVTTIGSVWHRHDRAATDSGTVRRLRAAGAVFVGKTNTPEFCQSSSTENLLGLDTTNPWDLGRTPGGSSGGSAAAVASLSCSAALGSDGGGSIRIPASFSGLVGLKPTYQRCPDEGGVSVFADLACSGPLAWRVDDVRRMFGVLADTAVTRSTTPKLRIGVCARPEERPVAPGVVASFERTVELLGAMHHELVEVAPDLHHWYRAFGPLLVSDEFARRGHLLEHPELLTDYERATLEAGRQTTEAQLQAARDARQSLRASIARTFDLVDVIVTPTTAVTAFRLGRRPNEIDGHAVSRLWGATPFTAAFNLTGSPAVAVPNGLVDGLPTSVQLVGRHGADELLLDLAEDLEAALGLDLVERVPSLSQVAMVK